MDTQPRLLDTHPRIVDRLKRAGPASLPWETVGPPARERPQPTDEFKEMAKDP